MARLEFTTRHDASIRTVELGLGKEKPESVGRSCFGIAEIVFHNVNNRETPKPESDPSALLFARPAPRSAGELAGLYAQVLTDAITAWRDHQLTEPQWAFLNGFVGNGTLPVTLRELPALAPLVAKYRALENSQPAPTTSP